MWRWWWIELVYRQPACVCICVRERNREQDMFNAFVFAHMPSSLCLCVPLAASAWICMCVFTLGVTRSLGEDWSPPWWAITRRLGWFFLLFISFFSYLPVYGNVTYKKMHAIFQSGSFRSLCADRLCALICLDNDVMEKAGRGDGAKVSGGGGGAVGSAGSRQQLLTVYTSDLRCVASGSVGGVHGCD